MSAADRTRPQTDGGGFMRGFPVPSDRRVDARHVYDTQASTRWFMQHVRQVLGTASLGPGEARRPLPAEPCDLSAVRVGAERLTVPEALRATHTDGFLVLRRGAVVDERYFEGMTAETPHMWQSISKSLVACTAGSLAAQGRLDVGAMLVDYVPELAGSGYADALVRHLLDMQVGLDYSEDYEDPDAEVNDLDRLYGLRPASGATGPGSTYQYAPGVAKKGEHGVEFDYVSLNVNVLAWVMERATGAWLPDLIRREVWDKLRTEHDAYLALDVAGSAQAESGVCTSLRDLARFGLALAHDGALDGRAVVPAGWIEEIRRGGDRAAFARGVGDDYLPGGSYKDCFWVARLPDHDAFLGSGIYGQMLYVNPQADVVVVKFSTLPVADDDDFFRLQFALAESLAEALA